MEGSNFGILPKFQIEKRKPKKPENIDEGRVRDIGPTTLKEFSLPEWQPVITVRRVNFTESQLVISPRTNNIPNQRAPQPVMRPLTKWRNKEKTVFVRPIETSKPTPQTDCRKSILSPSTVQIMMYKAKGLDIESKSIKKDKGKQVAIIPKPTVSKITSNPTRIKTTTKTQTSPYPNSNGLPPLTKRQRKRARRKEKKIAKQEMAKIMSGTKVAAVKIIPKRTASKITSNPTRIKTTTKTQTSPYPNSDGLPPLTKRQRKRARRKERKIVKQEMAR